jgi:hypothetical protein
MKIIVLMLALVGCQKKPQSTTITTTPVAEQKAEANESDETGNETTQEASSDVKEEALTFTVVPPSEDDKKASLEKLEEVKEAYDKKEWDNVITLATFAVGLDYTNYEAWYYKAQALENNPDMIGKSYQIYDVLMGLEDEQHKDLAGKGALAHARIESQLKNEDNVTRGQGCSSYRTMTLNESRRSLNRIEAARVEIHECIELSDNLCSSGSFNPSGLESCGRGLLRTLEVFQKSIDCSHYHEDVGGQVLWLGIKSLATVVVFDELLTKYQNGQCR